VAGRRGSAVRDDAGALRVVLDHGGEWQAELGGLADVSVAPSDRVARSQQLGVLAAAAGGGRGLLELAVRLGGEARDPRPYLLRA